MTPKGRARRSPAVRPAAGRALRLPAALACCLVAAGGALAAPVSLEETVRAAAKVPLGTGSTAVGSGAFVSPTHILTSAHVLAGCRTVVVTNRRIGTVAASIARREPRRDSAVLVVAAPQPAFLARPAPQRFPAGARLSILGYPAARAGGEAPFSQPATFGAVVTDEAGLPLLEMAAAAGPGMSGAPVLDAAGGLAGILVGRLDARPSDVVALAATGLSAETLGFFASRDPSAPAPSPSDAVVKIHCR